MGVNSGNQGISPKGERGELLSLFASAKEDIVDANRDTPHRNAIQVHGEYLTPREVEVLRLVTLGMNNVEIAHDLFISLNTVARHMTNIFSKTDTTNRVEAALYAARHGIS